MKNHFRKLLAKISYLLLSLITLSQLSGCGSTTASKVQDEASVPAEDPRVYWEELAQKNCPQYLAKANCDDGDMVLFGGLLCASGDQRGCQLVKDSQGEDGRWWRSPRRKAGNVGERKSFSRDMSMGVLLYLVQTKDREAATRWLNWIKDNRRCVGSAPFCVTYVYRYCTDESQLSCTIVPGNWALMGRVWEYLGLNQNFDMRKARELGAEGMYSVAEATLAPLGYELHLQGVEVLLKERLDVARHWREQVASILVQRQPENPFFRWLAGERDGTVRQAARELCPARGLRDGGSGRQWAWERDTAGAAWVDSMGLDCVFLDNLFQ